MKLLLVALNAKYIHSNPAVYSLLSYARKYSGHIAVIELTINHSSEEILKEIYKQRADVVAFSCYIWNISMVTELSTELKKVQPGVKIWYGGPEVSYDFTRRLNDNVVPDGIVIGEGEQTFTQLAGYYIEGIKSLDEIAGIAFKESARINSDIRYDDFTQSSRSGSIVDSAGNNRITVTEDRQQISLDNIPFPYKDMDTFRNRIIYYESSRGCPFSCSYCLSSIDRRVRFKSTELVKQELKAFLDYQVPQVKFIDRTFNCNKMHAFDIWSFIKDHDNGITNFHFEISADLLEEDELALLATLRPGQVQFEIGVQTTNPDTVEAIHRKMDFDRLSCNVLQLKKGGNIHLHLDLIAGLPLEGYTSFEKSFADVYRMKPDQLQLGFLKVLKGSFMESDAKKYGITYRSTPPYEVLFTEHLNYDELLKIKGVSEMVEIYYNSGQFSYSIGYLEHHYTSPMRLYEEISEYYDHQGIAQMAHSRIKRYEILLDFYKEKVLKSLEGNETDLTELFQELLVFDLYLREDLKSRPSFSPERPKKEQVKELYDKYRKGRQSIHIELFHFDVVASSREGKVIRKDTAFLFDYGSRGPLNNTAEFSAYY